MNNKKTARLRAKTLKTSFKTRRKSLFHRIFINRQIYIMLIPVILFYIIYRYVPMYGITLAWKDWRPKFGILGSPWVGWENFEWVFTRPDLARAIRNTFIISGLKLLICFPLPIVFAILLNEMVGGAFKKSIQ
ncbi:MAG TPA: protein lplB, partial [Clostridiales bacterium]|nr:protein lplB [Clostridiales bacterium]